MNPGQQALAQLRKDRAEKRDAELRAIRNVRSVDEFIRDDPTAASIPEKVALRMGSRMLSFVGIPLFGGMAAFVGFWYISTYKNVEIEPIVVAITTITLLVAGLAGITYSVMSASWDPDEDGSAVGIDEFKSNVESIKDGLARSKENAILRERMAKIPENELERQLNDLERRENNN